MSAKDLVARCFYPFGQQRTVLRGDAKGMRFRVEPGMGISYAIGKRDASPRFFRQYVSTGMKVLDVGANKGQMALIFAALVGPSGSVIAVEPAPGPFAALDYNVRLNKLSYVQTLQMAAADVEGEMQFLFDGSRPTQGKLASVETSYELPDAKTISVQARPLDALVDRWPGGGPDFMKIDVEGAAAVALRGARRILTERRPVIYIELHGPEEQVAVRDELLSRGYTAETLDGIRIEDPVSSWHSPLVCRPPAPDVASQKSGQ